MKISNAQPGFLVAFEEWKLPTYFERCESLKPFPPRMQSLARYYHSFLIFVFSGGFGNPELNLHLSNGMHLQGITDKHHTTKPNPFHDMITMIAPRELAVLASIFGWKTTCKMTFFSPSFAKF